MVAMVVQKAAGTLKRPSRLVSLQAAKSPKIGFLKGTQSQPLCGFTRARLRFSTRR